MRAALPCDPKALKGNQCDGVLRHRPVGLDTARRLGEEFSAADRSERVQLEVEGLIPGGDPGVDNVHGAVVSKPVENRKYGDIDCEAATETQKTWIPDRSR